MSFYEAFYTMSTSYWHYLLIMIRLLAQNESKNKNSFIKSTIFFRNLWIFIQHVFSMYAQMHLKLNVNTRDAFFIAFRPDQTILKIV